MIILKPPLSIFTTCSECGTMFGELFWKQTNKEVDSAILGQGYFSTIFRNLSIKARFQDHIANHFIRGVPMILNNGR